MDITLYEFEPTRSARVRWTLQELDVPFQSVTGNEVFSSDELKAIHPLGKLPAALIDGEPLFESAALCTHLADCHPEKGLIPPTGTRKRALHEQWVSFCLAEVEAHAWSNFRNTFLYPEERRVPQIIKQNNFEMGRSLKVLDGVLSNQAYLLGDEFSVTDIFVGYQVNGCRRRRVFADDLPNLLAWNHRLLERPASTLIADLMDD